MILFKSNGSIDNLVQAPKVPGGACSTRELILFNPTWTLSKGFAGAHRFDVR
jgi:hypothetical protein